MRAPGDSCLFDLVLAGSHDSCAYTVEPGVTSRAAIPPLHVRAIRWASVSVLRDFSATQKFSVLDQLRAGARFLDIRVSKLSTSCRDSQFWTVHGMAVCVPLDNILQQINQFHREVFQLKRSSRIAHDSSSDSIDDCDVPVVSVFRTFMLTEAEKRDLANQVRQKLVDDIFYGSAEELRATPLRCLPRNIVAGLPQVASLPPKFGHDAWLDTYNAARKITFLSNYIRNVKPRDARDDLVVVGWTVTPHVSDVVMRVASLGILRPAIRSEARKINSVFPAFLHTHLWRLTSVANVVFCDFFDETFADHILYLNSKTVGDSSSECSE